MVLLIFSACLSDPPPAVVDNEVAPPRQPFAATAGPLPDDGTRIEVSFPERAMQRLEVATTRQCPDSGTAEWWMANWTPGSYVIRDHARKVETIAASSGPVTQVAKNRWRVPCEPAEPVTVRVRLVATDRNVRGNYIAPTWATLNPPAAFLLPEPPTGPFDIVVNLPEGWPEAVAPLPRVREAPPTFRAVDVDTLIDSPLALGRLTTRTLAIGGADHHFVTFGDEREFDPTVLDTKVVDLVKAQQAFWGDVPYDEYWFLQAFLPTYGGLEHRNSTLMMSRPNPTQTPKDLRRWLGLVSHEFFHTWNVQRLRPRDLVAQDYETEAYTELLWVAEGWTSYYDDVLLARAGLIDEASYLELLGKQIDRVESRPGRLVQSLASSSFNAWTKYYHPEPHHVNHTVGYYAKGSVVAFLLDVQIRRATEGRRSLDDVARELRTLSEQPPESTLSERLTSMGARRAIRGITSEDVRQVASRIAGRDLGDFFDRSVDEPGELDYGPALQWFGLALDREEEKPRIQVSVGSADGGLAIEGVLRDGPAWRAGLNVGDVILAVDGVRATERDLEALVGDCEGPCAVLRSRDGHVAEVPVTPEALPGSVTLVVDEGASPSAARRRARWLGQ